MNIKSSILIILIYFISFKIFTKSIDLTELPAFIKHGYDNCNINQTNIEKEKNWLYLQPLKGNRPIQIPKLNIPTIPKRNFFELRTLPQEDFTIVFFINLTQEDIKNLISPAIYFERLGQNWEIFWNSISISNTLFVHQEATRKSVIIEIPKDVLKFNTNTLCIHLKGDPISTRTGFYYGRDYYIDNSNSIYSRLITNFILVFAIICIYLALGIFNFLFFLYQMDNKYNFYLSLFCFMCSLYIFSRSSIIYQFFSITQDIISFLELSSLFLLAPTFALFYYDIFKNFLSFFIKILVNIIIFHGLFFLSAICFFSLFSTNSYGGILLLWQYSIIIVFIITFIVNLYIFQIEIKNKNLSILKGLFFTTSGNFVIGIFFISFFAIFDILINLKKISSPNISNYGFLIFLSGITFRIIFNIFSLSKKIIISERKYHTLFEYSSDIIFILNKNFMILDINQAFAKELFLQKDMYIGKKLTQLIYKPELDKNFILKNLEEFLTKELTNHSPINITLPLIKRADIPVKFFLATFQILPSESEKGEEILLKCQPVKKDPTLKFLTKVYQKYVINSDFSNIEKIIPKITDFLTDFLEEEKISLIRIALREILINAIEHGNYEISNEEKTKYLKEGIYEKIIHEKINNPFYYNKSVIIEYKFTSKEIIYKITDEGKGFDTKKFTENYYLDSDSLHGRGIFITKNAFDKIQYNTIGNSVILIKILSK